MSTACFAGTPYGRSAASLKAEELASIEAPIADQAKAESRPAIGLAFLVRAQADQVIAERFNIPSFEQWSAGRA